MHHCSSNSPVAAARRPPAASVLPETAATTAAGAVLLLCSCLVLPVLLLLNDVVQLRVNLRQRRIQHLGPLQQTTTAGADRGQHRVVEHRICCYARQAGLPMLQSARMTQLRHRQPALWQWQLVLGDLHLGSCVQLCKELPAGTNSALLQTACCLCAICCCCCNSTWNVEAADIP